MSRCLVLSIIGLVVSMGCMAEVDTSSPGDWYETQPPIDEGDAPDDGDLDTDEALQDNEAPSVVASISFRSDTLQSLVADECLAAQGNGCLLPNRAECESLDVDIYTNAKMVGRCTTPTEDGYQTLKGFGEGIPLLCEYEPAEQEIRCYDANANLAVLYADHVAEIYPSNKNPGSMSNDAPPVEDNTETCWFGAQDRFVDSFNGVLGKETFRFSYAPTIPQTVGTNSFVASAAGFCSAIQKLPKCNWRTLNGLLGCHCWLDPLTGPTCIGSDMIDAAVFDACLEVPDECEPDVWAASVMKASADSQVWLTQGTEERQDQYRQAVETGIAIAAVVSLAAVATIAAVSVLSCPIVVDLDGDGIALTSVDQGVRFDLSGAGIQNTAWVSGPDDAFLAIDLDGNGVIETGRELFGDAFSINGVSAANGFEALAALDQPENGGDGNGALEADDLMFGQILLWSDSNANGRSEPEELASLAQSGIEALGTSFSTGYDSRDKHGNDLSLQGQFVRSDGTVGSMVDVYFTNH